MEKYAGIEPRQPRRFALLAFPWWSLFLCTPPFLSGCAALAPPTHKNAYVSTILIEPVAGAAGARSANFLLVGRAAVKGGKESFSGGVQWHHAEEGDKILLLSPLGQTLAEIRLDSGGAHLTTSEHQSYYAADVGSLTEEVLGWYLPLMGLQYWVQGVNSPATVAEVDVDMDGRITTIRQDGWDIDYLDYFPASASARAAGPAEGVQARAGQPRLLQLKRGGLQIKLVIDTWKSEEAGGA